MKIKALALAIGTLCAAGGVSAQTLEIVAGGASATRATITNEVIRGICGASGITLFQSGSNVTRITCPSTAVSGFTNLIFNYDNTTGSYLGIGPVSGAGTVVKIDPAASGCTAGTSGTLVGKTVLTRTNCNTVAGGRPAIGNADVEPDLFSGVLAPAGVTVFNPAGFDQVTGQYGVTFGIVVSQPLYLALQAEQGLTSLSGEAAVPSLTTAQIASLSSNNGGPLNQTWEPLFPNTAASNPNDTQPVRFIRRVAGSGSHASFSSQFLATNCSGKGLVPTNATDSTGSYITLEYGSTGNLLAAVDSTVSFPAAPSTNGANSQNAAALGGTAKPANYYAMGYASFENAETAGFKFVKVDGNYPSKANVQSGKYNWMAEQVLTLKSSPTPGESAFFTALATATGSPTVIANAGVPSKGIVALPFVADPGDTNYNAQKTRFRTFGNSCVRPYAVE